MEDQKKKNLTSMRWWLIRLGLVLFDIFAVNVSYFLALMIRYYVAFAFNNWALPYVSVYMKFAPFYTVCCLVIFFIFKFYNSRWKYAGFKDLGQIIIASFLTFVVHVAGTLVFFMRMPLTYYVLGALIQFTLIVISRYGYRFLIIERSFVVKQKQTVEVPVVIVGAGETSRVLLKYLNRNSDNVAKPVCMLDLRGEEFGDRMNGIPVLRGINKLESALQKYGAKSVIISDSQISDEVRKQVYEICQKREVDVQNYYGHLMDHHGEITLQNLLRYAKGPVELIYHGEHQQFENGEQAFLSLKDRCVVCAISATQERLTIEIQKDVLIPNNTKEAWVQDYKKETGEDISFF